MHRGDLEKQVHASVGVARRAMGMAVKVGRSKGNKCHMWAVGWAASVSEAHVRSNVMYIHSGVAPSVITQSCQAWARSLRIMPPTIQQHVQLCHTYL